MQKEHIILEIMEDLKVDTEAEVPQMIITLMVEVGVKERTLTNQQVGH